MRELDAKKSRREERRKLTNVGTGVIIKGRRALLHKGGWPLPFRKGVKLMWKKRVLIVLRFGACAAFVLYMLSIKAC